MKRSPFLLSLVSCLALGCSGSGFEDPDDGDNMDESAPKAVPGESAARRG